LRLKKSFASSKHRVITPLNEKIKEKKMRILFNFADGHPGLIDALNVFISTPEALDGVIEGIPEECEAVLIVANDDTREMVALTDYDSACDFLEAAYIDGYADFRDLCLVQD